VRALREHDVDGVCAKTFPSTDLPQGLAAQMGVPITRRGSPLDWPRDYRACLSDFGKHGEFGSGRVRVSVKDVEMGGPAEPAAGIPATAQVRATFFEAGATNPQAVWVVRYRGDWKQVVTVR
jgi:hypothetical protein